MNEKGRKLFNNINKKKAGELINLFVKISKILNMKFTITKKEMNSVFIDKIHLLAAIKNATLNLNLNNFTGLKVKAFHLKNKIIPHTTHLTQLTNDIKIEKIIEKYDEVIGNMILISNEFPNLKYTILQENLCPNAIKVMEKLNLKFGEKANGLGLDDYVSFKKRLFKDIIEEINIYFLSPINCTSEEITRLKQIKLLNENQKQNELIWATEFM